MKPALTLTQSLKLDELKELIKVQCISVSVAKLKKEGKTDYKYMFSPISLICYLDYVKAILCASNEKQPTEANIALIVEKVIDL
jgi:hypothetical protein